MGAPTLKIKQQLNYRKGTKDRNCGLCLQKVATISAGLRCKIFGLSFTRAYRINESAVCDQFSKRKAAP